MKRHSLYSCCLMGLAIISLGLNSSCTAPYDATGSYSGKWSFKDNATKVNDNQTDNGTEKIIDCPLTMTLVQYPPDNTTVRGTVHLDFECLTETSVWPAGKQAPAPTDVAVSGLIDSQGKLTIGSAGCGPGTCAILLLDGPGESDMVQGKKVMTAYSGNWGFALGIAFLGNLGISGTFEVDRD